MTCQGTEYQTHRRRPLDRCWLWHTSLKQVMALDGLGQPKTLYCRPLRVQSASVPVQELLDQDAGEEWIGGWPGVGIYEGNDKLPQLQSTHIHITTHRLLILSFPTPSTNNSVQLPLAYIRQTEFYTGFMRSSAKITVFLGPAPDQAGPSDPSASSIWTCGVCAFVNPGTPKELGGGASSKCGLCGVAFASVRASATSLPPTRPATPGVSTSATPTTPVAPAVNNEQVACPACTFLNHRSLSECEICSTLLPKASMSAAADVDVPFPTRPVANDTGDELDIIRLSFRKGGEKDAYRKLKSVLSIRGWEKGPRSSQRKSGLLGETIEELQPPSSPRGFAGIDGIMQNINLESKSKENDMNDAFQDIEALMVRAGEMVRLAQSLSAKLATPASEDESLIHSSLVQLGLPVPALTQDMVRSQEEYHKGLAKELSGILDGLMNGPEGRGMIGLDEVWGLWMRARGVSLLPPSALTSTIPHLYDITALSLPSGIRVLHTPRFAPEALLRRLDLPLGAIDIAEHEKISIALAGELMERIEVDGGLVRDEQAVGGVLWYRNLISGLQVDGFQVD